VTRGRAHAAPRPSVVLTVLMTVALAYYLLPLVWLVINSTKDQADLFSTNGLWFGRTFEFVANVQRLLGYEHGIYAQWFGNTAIYAVSGAAGSAILCSLGGYALAHFDFRGKRAAFAVIVGAVMIPGSVLALPIFLLCSQVGLTDTALAVILPSVASPFALYLMTIYASQAIPRELIEAARVDGAGELRIFTSIALRLLGPALVTVTLFQLTAAWNNYFLPLIVLNDDHKFPLAVGLAQLNAQATSTDNAVVTAGLYPAVLAGSLLAIVPLIVAFLLLQRFWRAGLATGAVKL
jgi:multiple sugar transport system permease protein